MSTFTLQAADSKFNDTYERLEVTVIHSKSLLLCICLTFGLVTELKIIVVTETNRKGNYEALLQNYFCCGHSL